MTNLREILIEWNTASGSGKRTVLNFFADIPVASQRTAIFNWLTAIKPLLSSGTQFGVAISGREFDDVTGTLTGAWTETSSKSSNGTGTGQPVADSTQVLVRWRSPDIVGGRFVQGRTFVPGLVVGNLSNGNVVGSAITTLQGAGNAMIASAAGLVVWHRPIAGSGGSAHTATTCDIWSELAVLRRRRG